jgi:hypothetical protein
LNSIPGKFAGEKQHWQAAKTKIGKNRAPKIPAARVAALRNNQIAGNEGRLVPTLAIVHCLVGCFPARHFAPPK